MALGILQQPKLRFLVLAFSTHLGLIMTIGLPALSVQSYTCCLPVPASELTMAHVSSWGLKLRRLRNQAKDTGQIVCD